MSEHCYLKVHINGQQTFFLNQRTISSFSGRLRRMLDQEKETQIRGLGFDDFPGGSDGFELVSRFCYNNGRICIATSNISLLYCSAFFLEMTEEFARSNLLQQTKFFLDGICYWTWSDILVSLKQCVDFFTYADSYGLLRLLITFLLAKISANSDAILTTCSSSSSSSSPETSGFRFSSVAGTPETTKPCFSKAWWFDDLTILTPNIIEKIINAMTVSGTDNVVITRFIFHYLKTAVQIPTGIGADRSCYGGLADAVVNGVILMGKSAISCRWLFWVLRVVSGLGLSKNCRAQIEKMIGEMLDQATLDDLLVSGHGRITGSYDVNLVLRLIRVFVSGNGISVKKMKKVGRLIDQYMGEISPDPNLKVSKFLGVAESLPDSARDCFDGVYRAVDIYLEAHPGLSPEERTRLCRPLNYKKLTLEACKDLAKNKRIPPRIAIQALVSQQSKLQPEPTIRDSPDSPMAEIGKQVTQYAETIENSLEFSDEKEELKMNLERMQLRVLKLEKICREMQIQMSNIIKSRVNSPSPTHNKALSKLFS